jgi:hypothetical protein
MRRRRYISRAERSSLALDVGDEGAFEIAATKVLEAREGPHNGATFVLTRDVCYK